METANSFTFFASYYDALQYLPDDDCGAMIKAICEFALRGNEPTFNNPILNGYWTLIKPTLERSIKRSEAGRRGGQSGAGVSRNVGNSNTAIESKSIANQNDINSDKERNRKGEEEETEVGKDKEEDLDSKGKKKEKKNIRFIPPTIDEVQAYCQERGNGIDAQHFVDFYTARGWKYGNTAIKDWRACIRTWEQRNGFKPTKGDKKQQQPPQANLGVGEFIAQDGTRRYGSGTLPAVPFDAPPRPDNESVFSKETNSWIPTGV